MYYKEWLRVRRGLICCIVIAAVLLVLHFLLIPFMGPHSGIVIDTDEKTTKHIVQAAADTAIPLSIFFAIAGVVAAIFAGIYGGSLSEENDGHLALAWTKPVSRERYALGVMGVDLAFLGMVFIIAVVFVGAIIAQHGQLHLVRVDGDAWFNLVRFILFAAAWYAFSQALTASLRQHSGTVRGLFFVAAVIVLAVGATIASPFWHGLLKLVNYLNPLAYASVTFPRPSALEPFSSWAANLIALAVIAVLGVVTALIQWRRLEA